MHRHIGDPILKVAATARKQAVAVKVEPAPLPVIGSLAASLGESAVSVHEDLANLCLEQPKIKGDAGLAPEDAAAVIGARFTTRINHQAPPQGIPRCFVPHPFPAEIAE